MPHYRMPAEWEPQKATWLAWPHNQEDWPDRFGPIPWVYVEIIRYLAQVQRVRLLVKNEKQRTEAQSLLKRAGVNLKQIDFYIFPTDRVWTRDSGPIFVTNGKKKAVVDFKFNGWAKYPNHKNDEKLPEFAARQLKLPCIAPYYAHKGKLRPMVLEGGSIDVNGKGTLLTTEECLLSKKQERNPGLDREGYESYFAEYLGISNTIWLGNGIAGDDTHGHVDDLARFTDATTIVTAVQKDKRDVDYAPLQDNLKRLKKARDQKGKPFTIVELPQPKPLYFEKQRLPMSYANFLIANDLVLVPTFNDPCDRVALNILTDLFPRRDVIGIYCGDMIWGLGTIHCASQQEPA